MVEVELEEIRKRAHRYHDEGMKWHFHLLTPTCVLNDKKDSYVFILDCPEKKEQLVFYSNRAEKELAEELSPMLHGAKVLNIETTDNNYEPSANIQKIIDRAKHLNEQKIEWHHHILFPDCPFNANSPKFTFLFEDPETGERIESLSNQEPINDLKQVEPLFFKK